MKATVQICLSNKQKWDNFPVVVEEADIERFVQSFVENSHHFSGPDYRFDLLYGAYDDAAKTLINVDVDEIQERARKTLKVRRDSKSWAKEMTDRKILLHVTEKLISNRRVWKRVKDAVKANDVAGTHAQRVQWKINEIDDHIAALMQRRDALTS